MQLYCPNCQQTSARNDHCPSCHIRMVTAAEVFAHATVTPELPMAAVVPTVLERFVLGTLIALGLYLSLHEWCMALVHSLSGSSDWDGRFSAVGSIVLQVVGVAMGSLIAGSGRKQGMSLGASIGLGCGGLFLALKLASEDSVTLIGGCVMLGLVALGTIAASIGCTLWPAPNELTDELEDPNASTISKIYATVQPEPRRPRMAWLLIILSGILGTVAVLGADPLREFLRDTLGSILQMGGAAKAALVDFEIAALLLILAGGVAGATTRRGLLQGAYAGVLAISLIGATTLANLRPDSLVIEGMQRFLEMVFGEGQPFQGMISFLMVMFILMVVGSWLGSQLLPPIKRKRKRGIAY